MQNDKDLKKPFFAAFLESQLSTEESQGVQGGEITTRIADIVQTMKYPSDIEESTKPTLDMEHTLKYPSDGDEI